MGRRCFFSALERKERGFLRVKQNAGSPQKDEEREPSAASIVGARRRCLSLHPRAIYLKQTELCLLSPCRPQWQLSLVSGYT